MWVVSQRIIFLAVQKGIPMEKNLESMHHKRYYRKEFWQLVPEEADVVYGLDAHTVPQLSRRWKKYLLKTATKE